MYYCLQKLWIFSRGHATLEFAVSVGPSVHPFVHHICDFQGFPLLPTRPRLRGSVYGLVFLLVERRKKILWCMKDIVEDKREREREKIYMRKHINKVNYTLINQTAQINYDVFLIQDFFFLACFSLSRE